MWQSLVRNWIYRTAREHLQTAASQAAAGAPGRRAPGDGQAGGNSASDEAPRDRPPSEPAVCHVGLVFALGIEAGGLVDRLAGVIGTHGAGFVAREGGLAGRRVVIVEAGAGAVSAARGTEALLAGHKPRWVISAGFAGALAPQLRKGDIVMPDRLVDLSGRQLDVDFRIDPAVLAATARLHVGRLLTADRIIGDTAEKRLLGERHTALAVDMETFAVAEVCRREKVRFMAVRVVSDEVDRQLPREVDNLVRQKSNVGRLGAATAAIFSRPSSIKDLWQLKEDALVASERLGQFLAGVIPQLG
jgi:adenosylhomocysteine nucleosidase